MVAEVPVIAGELVVFAGVLLPSPHLAGGYVPFTVAASIR